LAASGSVNVTNFSQAGQLRSREDHVELVATQQTIIEETKNEAKRIGEARLADVEARLAEAEQLKRLQNDMDVYQGKEVLREDERKFAEAPDKRDYVAKRNAEDSIREAAALLEAMDKKGLSADMIEQARKVLAGGPGKAGGSAGPGLGGPDGGVGGSGTLDSGSSGSADGDLASLLREALKGQLGANVDAPGGSTTFNALGSNFSLEIEPYIPGTNFKKAKAVLKNHKTVKKSGSNMSTADIISLIAEIRGGKG